MMFDYCFETSLLHIFNNIVNLGLPHFAAMYYSSKLSTLFNSSLFISTNIKSMACADSIDNCFFYNSNFEI